MENQTQNQEIEKEMKELNEQFNEFLHTKGITAKFKLAFSNMKESTEKQREIDKKNFESVKAKSAEENKDFIEFLHTKGLKAKMQLVVDNIKKGAKEASEKTKENIQKAKSGAYAKPNIPTPYTVKPTPAYTPQSLANEFNSFLKMKGLDTKYTVVVKENDSNE